MNDYIEIFNKAVLKESQTTKPGLCDTMDEYWYLTLDYIDSTKPFHTAWCCLVYIFKIVQSMLA